MSGGAGDRLGEHLPIGIEDPYREIAGFPDDGTERGSHQHQGLLIHDGLDAIPHDLQTHLVVFSSARPRCAVVSPSRTRLPRSSTRHVNPSGTTTVVWDSMTSAGPVRLSPVRRVVARVAGDGRKNGIVLLRRMVQLRRDR